MSRKHGIPFVLGEVESDQQETKEWQMLMQLELDCLDATYDHGIRGRLRRLAEIGQKLDSRDPGSLPTTPIAHWL